MKPAFRIDVLKQAVADFTETGDLGELLPIYKRYVNRANKQLKQLEKAGFAYNAYDIAVQSAAEFTRKGGKKRKRFGLPQSAEEVVNVLMAVDKFLSSKSSTVQGQIDIEQNRFNTFRSKYSSLVNIEDDELREFLRSLSEEELRTASQFRLTSDDDMDEKVQAFIKIRENLPDERKINKDDLVEAFTPFYNSEESLYELYDRLGVELN